MSNEEQLRQDISEIKDKLNSLIVTMRGDPSSDEPGGIVYNVSQNTKFRKNLVRIIWVLFGANAGIILYFISIFLGK